MRIYRTTSAYFTLVEVPDPEPPDHSYRWEYLDKQLVTVEDGFVLLWFW